MSCDFGTPAFACNNKLIGAYRFMAAYDHLLAKMTTKNKPPGGDLNPSAPTPGKWGQQGGLSPQWPGGRKISRPLGEDAPNIVEQHIDCVMAER